MKKIYMLAFLLILSVAVFAATVAHPVIVEVQDEDGSIPSDVFIQAWLLSNPLEILTQNDYDVYYHIDGYVHVQCGQFEEWDNGDVLHVELMAFNGAEAVGDFTLNYDNFQYYQLPGDGLIMTGGTNDIIMGNVFSPGWNLWSYNVMLASNAVEDVFAPLTNLTKVKSITQSYDPTLDPMFNTLATLVDGYGYWVRVSAEDALELTGLAIPLTTNIDLTTGWNLVAYLPQTEDGVENAFDSINDGTLLKVKSITQSYDPSLDPMFNTLEMLYPGNGYWVRVSANVTFNYSEPARNVELSEAAEYIWTPVIYTNSTCAYGYTTATEGYVGAFINNECRGIANVIDGSLSFVINGEEAETVSFKLYSEGQIFDGNISLTTDPGEDISGFEIDFRNQAPVVTGLTGTYPNPFNPQTTIAFDLAQNGNVNVSVYNIKGQKVTELMNSNLDAGQHRIIWNAENTASGIYFVRLNSGSVNQTQKVILMK